MCVVWSFALGASWQISKACTEVLRISPIVAAHPPSINNDNQIYTEDRSASTINIQNRAGQIKPPSKFPRKREVRMLFRRRCRTHTNMTEVHGRNNRSKNRELGIVGEASDPQYSSAFLSSFVLWRQDQHTIYDLKPQRLRPCPRDSIITVHSF